jgi:protein SCO1
MTHRFTGRRMLLSMALLILMAILAGCRYEWKGTTFDPPQAAGEISGTNWDNTPFQLTEQRGKVSLIFFGYTNCPDVCPTTLAEMRVLHQELGAQANKVAVVFVSVDPERDTVERLGEYIPAFNDQFYGVFVEPGPLEQVKKDYMVYAEKRYYEGGESASKYSVDHTARVYLVDPGGNLVSSYPFGTVVADILADVQHVLKG